MKIHCDHCQTPLSDWQPMGSYQSERSCEAYGYLIDVLAQQQHRPLQKRHDETAPRHSGYEGACQRIHCNPI
jgi:hypothetical protein